ncbi:hypothetical protein KAT08_01575 [Candidatus Babeliales bacterium]|nr:hypothetical protein [Candidatus Babeliales bacterium]
MKKKFFFLTPILALMLFFSNSLFSASIESQLTDKILKNTQSFILDIQLIKIGCEEFSKSSISKIPLIEAGIKKIVPIKILAKKQQKLETHKKIIYEVINAIDNNQIVSAETKTQLKDDLKFIKNEKKSLRSKLNHIRRTETFVIKPSPLLRKKTKRNILKSTEQAKLFLIELIQKMETHQKLLEKLIRKI